MAARARNPVDVLLVNPGSRSAVYQQLGEAYSAIEPPSLAGLFATYLRKRGLSVDIVDAPAHNLGPTGVAQVIRDNFEPVLIVMVVYGFQPSASTQNMTAAGETCAAIKALRGDWRIMMTGTHPAALPERTLREENIDFVCDREGPETILLTAQALKARAGDFSKIPSLWYRDGGAIHSNPPAGLMDDLDGEMPGVAWDLLPMERYRAHNWHCFEDIHHRAPYVSMHTSLGCPYKCTFCCINAPFGKPSYRLWSPDSVIAEIDRLVEKYGVKNIKFVDEMFVLNRSHVLGICDRILSHGHQLNIWAYARVDTVKDEFLDKLARAGFRWLALGIESGSKHVRDGVEKGRFGSTDILRVVRRIQDAGINVIGNYIFGLPDDTRESMQETLDLALEANCEFANFYCLPPGTPVYTPHGTQPIEEIRSGDEVLSWSGRSVVKGPMSRHYKGKMYRIKPRFLSAVRLTDEHPILVATINRSRFNAPLIGRPRWVKPANVVPYSSHSAPYDAVIVPKSCFAGRDTEVDFSPYVNGHVGPGRKGGQLGDAGKRYLEPWPVTEELAELCGWYVAEGSRFSRKNKQIGFSLGASESENVARVRHLVGKCFGLKTRVRAENNVHKVTLTSKVLLRALPAMFGESSCEKRVPAFIMESRENIARAFLSGYVAGDGTSSPNANGQFNVSTCSPILARQLIPLFMKTGIVPGCFEVEPQVNRKGSFPGQGKQYRLSWTEGKATHCFEDERHFYIPVAEVTSHDYDGMVYNIETGDETYALPFIVHNCAMAYPGSRLYTLAVEKRWQLPETWIGYSQHSYETLPLRTDALTSAEVLKFRDDAFHRYFADERYLALVRRKFGEDVLDHVRDMTKIRLKRKLLEDDRKGARAVPA